MVLGQLVSAAGAEIFRELFYFEIQRPCTMATLTAGTS